MLTGSFTSSYRPGGQVEFSGGHETSWPLCNPSTENTKAFTPVIGFSHTAWVTSRMGEYLGLASSYEVRGNGRFDEEKDSAQVRCSVADFEEEGGRVARNVGGL